MRKIIIRDKTGYPVEWIKGHSVQKWIRFLIHGSISQTWKGRDR